MPRTLRVALATLAVQTLVLSSVASAHSDVVADAQGDVAIGSPGYVDIVQAKVTEQIGKETLYFSVELAGEVPATPSTGFLSWNWLIDVPGGTAGDFGFVVRWCSQAVLTLCGAGPAHWESGRIVGAGQIAQPFDFKISGSTVKAYVDTAQVGGATGFDWRVLSRLAPAPSGQPPVDLAPDAGAWSTFNR
jgi:hypothetical protein